MPDRQPTRPDRSDAAPNNRREASSTARTSTDGADDSDNAGDLLRALPSVNEMAEHLAGRGWEARVGRAVIVRRVREATAALRRRLRDERGRAPSTTRDDLIAQLESRIEAALSKEAAPPLAPVINATGIILHTGLGRAPIAGPAVEALAEAAARYAPVEIDLESGKRGQRSSIVRRLLCEITGAESATVVNNNAAAMMLVLAALAKDREVIVSRGELVEIGGSFRLPDVIESGGARLREVGTTNKTRPADYADAINENTAAILKVHASNFRIEGFTQESSIESLAAVGRQYGLPIIHDTGSGMLVDPREYGLEAPEPNARESIRDGADLVLCGGDKLLGGPQSGVIIGRRDLIERIEHHPMMRTLRVDKITLAALGRILRIHRAPKDAARMIPALRMAMDSPRTVRRRCEDLISRIGDVEPLASVWIEDSAAYLGGGSVPGREIASAAVAIAPRRISVDALAARLRQPADAEFAHVIGRVRNEAFWLDLRTVFDDEAAPLAEAIRRALSTGAE